MVVLISPSMANPSVFHKALGTTFTGVEHPVSTPKLCIHHFRGIKYATIPDRFRQSRLFASFAPHTDATKYGPVCPQLRPSSFESDLLGEHADSLPSQVLKQSEFDCLNLNIMRPAGYDRHSRLPVMVWFHGGWARGSGCSWLHDGGAFVRKSAEVGRPVVIITFNFRIGLFGTVASSKLQADNETAGDKGVGNYGLRDQQILLQWIHNFISDFGGDPLNVTLFGESTGASDILCHLHSSFNQTKHLFHRAIVQSPVIEYNIPDVRIASSRLSKTMASLHVSTVEELRNLSVDMLVANQPAMRATDDGHFFRNGWKSLMFGEENAPHEEYHSLPLQPIIIGDCTFESSIWSYPTSYWTPAGVVRRVRAICQSLQRANSLLRAYDISSYTPENELEERVLDLINDTRFACPINCVAEAMKKNRGGRDVYRYVFDQESPSKGIPHHAVDLIYLFDNVPLPTPAIPIELPPSRSVTPELSFSGSDDEGEEFSSGFDMDDAWMTPVVDEWSYSRVRDTIQERWIAFAYGDDPWHDNKVFVFGPEGETGERSSHIFDGRRRTNVWKSTLLPLGLSMIQKVGEELSSGPVIGTGKGTF